VKLIKTNKKIYFNVKDDFINRNYQSSKLIKIELKGIINDYDSNNKEMNLNKAKIDNFSFIILYSLE
jgi:hypothetical protein